ncbi:MAG: glutamate--tRNA ligase family protein, partial [Nanoarchaeota archaeon]
MKISDKKIRAYALKNAIHYNGEANSGAVISALFHEGLKKSEAGKYAKKVSEIVLNINRLSLEEQKKEFEILEKEISEREIREGLQDLPNANKGVIMRIAPSASGPMHLFHGLNASLSFDYFLKYGGKFYVRIEDTNPENIDINSYEMLKEDAKWLTKGKAKIVIQSERMELYYDYA